MSSLSLLAALSAVVLPAAQSAAPVQAAGDGVPVEVDPRIELMAVVQLLAGYPVLTSHDSPYRADAREFFGPHAGHPAVATFDSMAGSGFAFDAVPKAFAWMTPLPELRLASDAPTEVTARAGGADRLAHFARLAASFARAADFAAFYRAHTGTYRRLVDSAAGPARTAIRQLEEYTGMPLSDARVVLSPLLHDGGFAMRGGDPAAQAFIGPVGIQNGFPDFGGAERLGPLLWHEFAHTVINPATEGLRTAVDSLEIRDEAFRSRMRSQAYADWATIVNESIIRAIEVRLATRIGGAESGARALARQVRRGFAHVPRLAELLESYESDRASYPTIASYVPVLLQAFREPVPRDPQ